MAFTYLIIVIFFTLTQFFENKISTKRVNYDKIHRKLPIFCVITAKYTVDCSMFIEKPINYSIGKKSFDSIQGHAVRNPLQKNCGQN